MTRIALLFAFVLFGSLSIQAQDKLDDIAKKACDCIGKSDLTGLSTDDRNMKMGLCIMESMGELDAAAMKELGIDMSNQESMMKFGEKIGLRMATQCPTVMMSIMEVQTKTESVSQESGTIKRMAGTEMTMLVLEDATGDNSSYLILEAFEGSDALMADLVGKKATVNFKVVEIFSPSDKAFVPRKVITGLKLN
ncbi:MAG: hypothetical protein AAFO07_23590 [Bacteroidota bacterium]